MLVSRGTYALWSCLLLLLVVSGVGCPPAATVPEVTDFAINAGAATAASRTVTLDSLAAGVPDEYIASESPSFTGATWQPYSESIPFLLSSGDGTKTVYFQVRNSAGTSAVVSDTIALQETEVTVLLPGNVPLAVVWVPAGTFQMGRKSGEQDSFNSEAPQHSVTVSGFWMAKYEVTKRQWQAVMGTTPWSNNGYVLNNPDSAAVLVSWDDAKAFVTALNDYTGLAFRLPSEAEWEYACRAGTTTRFYWGDDASYSAIGTYAWWFNNAWLGNQAYANVVGQKQPNARGLYDMIGNAYEWCEDDWHEDYTGAVTNGSAWVGSPASTNKVVRGGSWYTEGRQCRSASRTYYSKTFASYLIGFRLAHSD